MIINPEDFGDSLTSLPQKHLLNVSLGADTAVMNINHVMPNSHWFQIVKCDAEFCFLNTFELWIVGGGHGSGCRPVIMWSERSLVWSPTPAVCMSKHLCARRIAVDMRVYAWMATWQWSLIKLNKAPIIYHHKQFTTHKNDINVLNNNILN